MQQKLPLRVIHLPVILSFEMLRQEDYKFKDCIEKPWLGKRKEQP